MKWKTGSPLQQGRAGEPLFRRIKYKEERGEGIGTAKWDGKSRRTALLRSPIYRMEMTFRLLHYTRGGKIKVVGIVPVVAERWN